MQYSVAVVLCALLSRAVALRARTLDSPVQKVVELLGSLEAKIVKDGEKQQAAFEAYSEWCRTGAQDKAWEIKTATAEVEDLSSIIAKAGSDISSLQSKLEDLAAEISTNEGDLKAATEIREKEHAEFRTTESELVDAVDTLERATNVLQRKLGDAALMQAKVNRKDVQNLVRTLGAIVDAAGLSLHDQQRLTALAQQSGEDDGDEAEALGAPAPEAYTSHSESIIDVLEDLKQKAENELTEVRRAEVNSRHNYEMLKQSLEDQVKVDTKAMADAKSMKANAIETKASAEGDLAKTKEELADAKAVLGSMSSDCAAAARDHEESLKTRQEELAALAAAKKAISEMTGAAAAATYSAASFLQLDGSQTSGLIGSASTSTLRTRVDLANFEVVNLVRKLARETHSAALAQLASRITATMHEGSVSGADPFAKVKELISSMIERLIKEGGEEMAHKAYCDKEMAETKQKLDELHYDLEKLGSKIDKSKAASIKLKDEVATLSRELNEIARSQAEADTTRQAEKKAYEETKADLEQGLEGIRLALKVLRDYYANVETKAAALIQQPDAPENHAKAEGAGTTIIGLLEVIESDFGKAAASNEIEEMAAATAYEKMSMQNRVSKAMKEKDVTYKTKEAASLDKAVTELSSDRDSAQTELDAVLEYSKNIRGMCVLKPESYEERTARRQQEIDGLKAALEVLQGEAVLLQQAAGGKRFRRR